MDQLQKLEKLVAYLSIAGSFMVANQFAWGWVVYLAASLSGMWWSYLKNYRHMLIMNSFFTIANCCGIYNYILH